MLVEEFVSISQAKPEPKPETQVLLLSNCEIYEPKAIMRITYACAEPRINKFRATAEQRRTVTALTMLLARSRMLAECV